MTRQTLYQPLPPTLTKALLFVNSAVGLVSAFLITQGNGTAAAYVALGAGILNQAVNIFIGQNPQTHEQTTDSTLPNRRDFVREEKTGYGESGRTKGGAK